MLHQLITSKIGDISKDILDESDENDMENDKINYNGVGGNNEKDGKGDFDYDINDILDLGDDDSSDDNEEW